MCDRKCSFVIVHVDTPSLQQKRLCYLLLNCCIAWAILGVFDMKLKFHVTTMKYRTQVFNHKSLI